MKAIYALAQESHPAIVCLVALSPPRLSYAHFSSGPQSAQFLEAFAAASEHVRSGRSDALLDVRFPLPFVVTASGYLEKYGPDERYNYLKFVDRAPCRTLISFGSIELEQNVAFRGSPEVLTSIVAEHSDMKVVVIDGADHFYSAVREKVIQSVVDWLGSPGRSCPRSIP